MNQNNVTPKRTQSHMAGTIGSGAEAYNKRTQIRHIRGLARMPLPMSQVPAHYEYYGRQLKDHMVLQQSKWNQAKFFL